MLAKYDDSEVIGRWTDLRRPLDGFSKVRNNLAHLVPMAQGSTDPGRPANARLVPPFWKRSHQQKGDYAFDRTGFSEEEVWKEIAPYWGYHPRTEPYARPDEQLSYKIQNFAGWLRHKDLSQSRGVADSSGNEAG